LNKDKYELFINQLSKELEKEDIRREYLEKKVMNFMQVTSLFIFIIGSILGLLMYPFTFFHYIVIFIIILVIFILSIFLFIISLCYGLKSLKITKYYRFDVEKFINEYNDLDDIEIKKGCISEFNNLIKLKEEANTKKVNSIIKSYKFLIISIIAMVITIILFSLNSILAYIII